MAIIAKLDIIMKEKGYTVGKLAEKVGISPVNLSNIKNGNISAIRFSTLNEICKVLKCQPGDILEYNELDKKKVIPLFLDYSGTTDLLLKGGAENVKRFFDAINQMQLKSKCEVQITMVTGSSFESAKSKFKLLNELAENYGLNNLFSGVVAEYCGFIIRKDKLVKLFSLDTRLLEKKYEIEQIINPFGGIINPSNISMYNVFFNNISRTDLATVSEQIEKLLNDDELETVNYYDSYGKEIDIKPKIHSKSEAVYRIVEELNEKYDIPFVIIGGDSQDEDLKMYTQNKDRISKIGLQTIFIAPSNICEFLNLDNNIIVGNWEKPEGVAECIEKINLMMTVNEEGEIII